MLEIEYLGTQYIIKSNKDIGLNNAMESLNFDVKAEGLHILSNFKNVRGNVTVKSLLLHGRANYGAMYFQVYCHEVAISLKMKFSFMNLVVKWLINSSRTSKTKWKSMGFGQGNSSSSKSPMEQWKSMRSKKKNS